MKHFRWWIEFLLFKLVTLPFIWSPRIIRKKAGRLLAFLFYAFSIRHRRTALRNLEIAFPANSLKWRKKTALNCFLFLGEMLADIISYSRLKASGLKKLLSHIDGEERLKEAYNKGRGVLCMASHFGNWEFLSLGASISGFKVAVVARQSDNPLLEKELYKSRTTTGVVVIYKKDAIKNIIKYLKKGYVIGFLIDQNQIEKDGIFVDFFGKKASTTPTLSMLALKYNIPVIPCYCVPEGNKKYRLVFDKLITTEKTGKYTKDVKMLTQECTSYIENLIKKYPSYWLWMHKRWKTRPPGEKTIY